MIDRLNHVAIAVPDLKAAAAFYRDVLGAQVSEPVDLLDHGVSTVFVQLSNTKLELITPLGDNSPIAGYLEKHPAGGLHHLCFQVHDMAKSIETISKAGVRTVSDPKPGSQGKLVVFMHPKDTLGCLLELEESS
jgi:methylmalonyl-CoA/ethylmalonyl-CoA epimerase